MLTTLKPRRPPRRPKISAHPPLTSALPQVATIDPTRLPQLGKPNAVARPGLAVGLVLGGAVLTTATLAGLQKLGESDGE